MAIKPTTAFKVATNRGVKMAVYGRSGMGKTMLAATLPTPIVIGSAEAGLLSLSKANQLRVFGTAVDMDVYELATLDDLVEFHEWMSHPECPYASIVLDSVSEIAERVLSNALKQVKDPRQAYGELQEKMTDVFKLFRDIDGKHVLFVAKEQPNKDGCTPLMIPAMPGSRLGAAMPYLVDEVFHIDVATTPDGTLYRLLQTQPSVQFDAKDRSGALDPIEEPNLSKLIAKIVS